MHDQILSGFYDRMSGVHRNFFISSSRPVVIREATLYMRMLPDITEYAEDFDLYVYASIDAETGKAKVLDNPEFICSVKAIKDRTKDN